MKWHKMKIHYSLAFRLATHRYYRQLCIASTHPYYSFSFRLFFFYFVHICWCFFSILVYKFHSEKKMDDDRMEKMLWNVCVYISYWIIFYKKNWESESVMAFGPKVWLICHRCCCRRYHRLLPLPPSLPYEWNLKYIEV